MKSGEYLGYRWEHDEEVLVRNGVSASGRVVAPDSKLKRDAYLFYTDPPGGPFRGQSFPTIQARIEAEIRRLVQKELEEGEP